MEPGTLLEVPYDDVWSWHDPDDELNPYHVLVAGELVVTLEERTSGRGLTYAKVLHSQGIGWVFVGNLRPVRR